MRKLSGTDAHTHSASDITSGTFQDSLISESSVTQHEAALTITESQISDLQAYLTGITGEPLGDLSNVTITTPATGELLKYSSGTWINNTLSEAGVSAVGHAHTESDISDLKSYLLDTTDTFTGNLTITNNLIVDTDTLFVDASTNRVGINNSSPSQAFQVGPSTPTGVSPYSLLNGIRISGGDTGNSIYAGSRNLSLSADNGKIISIGRVSVTQQGLNVNTTNNRVGVGISSPGGTLHVDQTSGSGAVPVLYLDQADTSEEFIRFQATAGTGNSIEAVGAKSLTVTEFIRVNINGTDRYLQVGTIA